MTSSTQGLTDSLNVNDQAELMVLLRTVMEAKFRGTGSDSEILGSPLLAGMANRIVQALIAIEKERGQYSEARWQSWLKLDPTRREWKVILKRVKGISQWSLWSAEERSRFLDDVASPLILTDARQQLMQELNAEGC